MDKFNMSNEELEQRYGAAYDAGQYSFAPPPVCSGAWGRYDWIRYVNFYSPDCTNERMRRQGIGKRKIKYSTYEFYDIKTEAVLFTGGLDQINEHLEAMEKGASND